MTRIAATLFLAAYAAGARAQAPSAHLSVTRNAAGDVVAAVNGTVRACGITSGRAEPTFVLRGNRIEVTQPTIAVACMNPPPTAKPYRHTLDFGRLPAGRYTIQWSFPELSAEYEVTP